jgi:phosphodiesterase/alkaline phosphatase D-like protein
MSDLDELKVEEEIALSLRVRTLCQIHGDSAENAGNDGEDCDERQRYENVRKEVLEIAIKLTDEVHRNAALHLAFDFCMKARDFPFATIIADAITRAAVQEQIVEEYGEYYLLSKNDNRLHPTLRVRTHLSQQSK